jgi:hypothetical protein
MKKAFFALLIILTITESARAQGVDSTCLVLWQNSPLRQLDYVWENYDSVKVDMCGGPQYLSEFGKTRYVVPFLYYIFPDSTAPVGDSLEKDWRDIDSIYYPIKNACDSIEQQLGSFTLQHEPDPGDTVGDTSKLVVKNWFLNFNTYLNIDTATYYIALYMNNVPQVNAKYPIEFDGLPDFYEGVNEKADGMEFSIWPQPCRSSFNISGVEVPKDINFFDQLGCEISFPVTSSDGILTVDVSKQPDGVVYFRALGQFFKILINH